MSGTMRNRLLAGALATLFVIGATLIIWSALKGDSGGTNASASGERTDPGQPASQGPDPGAQESPDTGQGQQGNGNRQVRSLRIGGATVDNQYPIANFGQGFTNGRSCAGLQNVSEALPITVVGVSVGPPGVYEARDCNSTMALSSTNLSTTTPCRPGVVLLPRPRRQGCSVGVQLLVTGTQRTYAGTVTLVTRATCTSRSHPPCNLLPADVTPTEAAPIALTVDQRIPFSGSDSANSSSSPDTGTGESPAESPGESASGAPGE